MLPIRGILIAYIVNSTFACFCDTLKSLENVMAQKTMWISIAERIVVKLLTPSLLWISKTIPELSLIDRFVTRLVIPRPNMRLKTGPAIHPVIAISPRPALLIEIEAKASPTLLPQDSTVNPSSEDGNPVISPTSSNNATIISAKM